MWLLVATIILSDSAYKFTSGIKDNHTITTSINYCNFSTKLVVPNSVAVNGNGVVAISDWGTGQVKMYSLQGKFLSALGIRGTKDGQFNCPMGLAFCDINKLFVVDSDNYRVQVFKQDGTFVLSFGGERIPQDSSNILLG